MPKLKFDWDIMQEYNDSWVLIYEWWYWEYKWEVIGLWIPVCKQWKGKEYFDDWALKYEWDFKNGKYDWYWKEYYKWLNVLEYEWEYKQWQLVKWKRYNPDWIVYDWDFNEDGEKHWKWKYIYEWVLYYDWEFQHNEIHWKWKLYDEGWILAYDGDFVKSRREWNGKYYKEGKLVYNWERKDGIPLKPREWYSKDEEDERYANDLCWRFWCQYTALQEHRKWTL